MVLALMIALTLGAASTAVGHPGFGGLLHLNHSNTVNAVTRLVGSVNGASLLIDNNSSSAAARALALQVEPGRPPMTVNSNTRVNNLNADQLDSTDSTAFAQPLAFGTESIFGTLSSGENFILGTPFTPRASGKCVVTASTQISGSANTSLGPFYRIAIRHGTDAPINDGLYGHYFTPNPSGFADDMTRSSVISVTGGQPVQFGAYLGFPEVDWQGDSADVHLTYMCTTPGTGTVGTASAITAGAAEGASAQEKAKAEAQVERARAREAK